MNEFDPWVVLGVAPESSIEAARAARRRLAKELHPDVHGAAFAERMSLVNQAMAEIESRPLSLAGDVDSFSVECLPVDAFEALFLATYGLGDILVADEPYLLEVFLKEPGPCFCRLELVPEAGASLVTVDVSPASDTQVMPSPAAVIEVLVRELNGLVAG